MQKTRNTALTTIEYSINWAYGWNIKAGPSHAVCKRLMSTEGATNLQYIWQQGPERGEYYSI